MLLCQMHPHTVRRHKLRKLNTAAGTLRIPTTEHSFNSSAQKSSQLALENINTRINSLAGGHPVRALQLPCSIELSSRMRFESVIGQDLDM